MRKEFSFSSLNFSTFPSHFYLFLICVYIIMTSPHSHSNTGSPRAHCVLGDSHRSIAHKKAVHLINWLFSSILCCLNSMCVHLCTSVPPPEPPWSAGNGSDRKESGWNLNFREQRGHHLLRIMTQMLERFECTVTYHM